MGQREKARSKDFCWQVDDQGFTRTLQQNIDAWLEELTWCFFLEFYRVHLDGRFLNL